VSKLGDFDSYGADPRRIEKAGDSFNGMKVDYASKYKSTAGARILSFAN
jgi:hypothetical protein